MGLPDSATSLPRQPHLIRQLQTLHNSTQPNQQRILGNATPTHNNLIVSPHMSTRTPLGLTDANAGTVVLPNANSSSIGNIRMTTRPLQQLPNLPTTSGIILQQMANTISPTGAMLPRASSRLVIGTGAIASHPNNPTLVSSLSGTVPRYIQTQTRANTSVSTPQATPIITSISSANANVTPTTNLLGHTGHNYGSSQPHTLMLRRGVQSSTNQAQASDVAPKENLYIVALPSSEQHRLVQCQVGSNTTTNITNTSKAQTLLFTNPNPTLGHQGAPVKIAASDNVLKQALCGTVTGHISGTASPTQVERRNVAEILASLSGFMPQSSNNPAIITTPRTDNVVTTIGSSLQVIPSSRGKSTPTSAVSSGSNLVIEPITSTKDNNTTILPSSLASTPSGGITITAFKSKPPPLLSATTVSTKATIITSTKTTGIRNTATILNASTSVQNAPTPSVVSTPATRVVRVLQSATGSTGRQIIHQSGGSGLSIASSPTPVVIARKSTATPTSVVSTTNTSTTTTTSTTNSNTGQARSRKQVLIPVDIQSRLEERETSPDTLKNKDVESKLASEGPSSIVSEDDSSVAKRTKRRRHSSTANVVTDSETSDTKISEGEGKRISGATERNTNAGIMSVSVDNEILASKEFEQDILEEDLDDLEYVPYTSRKSKAKKSSNKGRMSK